MKENLLAAIKEIDLKVEKTQSLLIRARETATQAEKDLLVLQGQKEGFVQVVNALTPKEGQSENPKPKGKKAKSIKKSTRPKKKRTQPRGARKAHQKTQKLKKVKRRDARYEKRGSQRKRRK